MGRYYQTKTESLTLGIGIQGDLRSLCGAVKRLERKGKQWNGLLSLKEQCARRIARMKNEQMKCFILGYLPPHLFKYVTKDIFNLRRDEFTSKYPRKYRICNDCISDTGPEPDVNCRCPDIEGVVERLNRYFFKRMNPNSKTKPKERKQLEIIYKMPDEEDADWHYDEAPMSYFLHLVPCKYNSTFNGGDGSDMETAAYQSHQSVDSQVSVKDKLLFVDIMRVIGAFHSEQEEPQLILS